MLLHKKAFWRRTVVFALVVASALAAALLILREASVLDAAHRQQHELGRGASLRIHLMEAQTECTIALALRGKLDEDRFRARIAELVGEIQEVRDHLAPVWAEVGLGEEASFISDEIAEISATRKGLMSGPLQRENLAALYEDASRAEKLLLNITGQPEAIIKDRLATGILLGRIVLAVLALDFVFGLIGILLLVSDGLNEVFGFIDLDAELSKIAGSAEFQQRMRKLCPHAASEPATWHLGLHKKLNSHRTHDTFEAKAVRGDREILLWGKAYRWAGKIKQLQRIFTPAYAKATWQALLLMSNADMGSPFPVVWTKIKRGHLVIGSVLLAEHVGPLESVKHVLRTDFVLLDYKGRLAFVRGLIEFCNRAHELGLHRFTPRYLHTSGLTPQDDAPPQFYLFDIDKVHISKSASGWWYRYSVRHDQKRLLHFLRYHLTPSELQVCKEMLQSS